MRWQVWTFACLCLLIPFSSAFSEIYYASPSARGDRTSPQEAMAIVRFWEIARPGDVLVLLTGTYAGRESMTAPPQRLSGTQDAPITIRAMNDGRVTIDGQSAHRPAALYHNDWFVIEGINAHSSKSTVVNVSRSSHCIVRWVCGWDAASGRLAT